MNCQIHMCRPAVDLFHTLGSWLLAQGAIEFVEEQDNDVNVTSESCAGEVVGEVSFLFGMPQNSSARSKLNHPGATLYTLKREVGKHTNPVWQFPIAFMCPWQFMGCRSCDWPLSRRTTRS